MDLSKSFKFIETPRSNVKCNSFEDFSLTVDSDFFCSGTYKDGGVFGSHLCNGLYTSGTCSGSDDYCQSYSECTFHLG